MPTVTLDLATKIIPKDQTIWVVFPGHGKRLLDTFLAKDCIFLETPGINLDPKVLADEELLRRHLAMSEAVMDYVTGAVAARPSARAADYPVHRSASFSASVGNVRSMFAKMKPRDLVIVPGKSLYKPIYAGEIVGQFRAEDQQLIPLWQHYEVPVRHVRWFDVRQERRYLSERLSRLLSNRRTVISVGKAEFGDEVFKLAYGDYVYGEDSRYAFDGPRYNNIATSTVPGIDLLSYFIAAYNAAEIGELDKFSALEIAKATERYFEQDILYSFELDFASPGGYVIHARQAALALTVALLVSATSGTISHAEARAATVINSADHVAQVHRPALEPLPIPEKYKAIMDTMKADKFNELVQLNKSAQAGVGLKVRVKQRRHKK